MPVSGPRRLVNLHGRSARAVGGQSRLRWPGAGQSERLAVRAGDAAITTGMTAQPIALWAMAWRAPVRSLDDLQPPHLGTALAQ